MEELYHYGVIGMKWGVHRARSKSNRRDRLLKKAAKYDMKSAKAMRKSDKIHSDDVGNRSRKVMLKADKFKKKSAKLMKKSVSELNDIKKLSMERKSAKYQLKAQKKNREANSLRRTTAYSMEAERYAAKSDKYAAKAAKARYTIANDKRYIALMQKKVSELTEEQRNGNYAFVKEMFE